MTIKIDYSAYDFTEIKNELISYLRTTNTFKDYNFAGSNILTLVELVAAVGDLFNFYINSIANEYYIDTAELYTNLNRISKQLGYNPGGVKASSTTVTVCATFDLPADDYYFEIPKYSTFLCPNASPLGEQVNYCLTNDVIFVGTSGSNVYSAEWFVVQGEPYSDAELGEKFSADGTEFQSCELSSAKAIEEYLEVWVNHGVTNEQWTYVANLYTSPDSTAKVFTTRVNSNKKVEITFGNGTFGVIPPYGADNITVYYIESLGQDGRIEAGAITSLVEAVKVYRSDGNITEQTIDFTITQADPSDGGRDPLTETEIKNLAPKFYRTQDRMVTIQDHEDKLLTGYSDYISKVLTVNSDDYFAITGETPETSGLYYNNIYLYILPVYGDTVTENLSTQVLGYIEDYKMTSLNYVLKPIVFYNISPIIRWKKDTTTTKQTAEITADIESALRVFFSRANRTFGEEIKYSVVLKSLQEIEGISSLTLALSGQTSPISAYYENLVLDAIDFPRIDPVWDASTKITYASGGN